MSIKIEKKPLLIRNGIVQQLKQAANSLTIQEWNSVVNTLKTQTNVTVEYLEKLHRVLFGVQEDTGVHEFLDEGVIYTLLTAITDIRNEVEDALISATLKTNFYGKANENITKGDFIMFGGAQGDHILFVKANVNATGFIPEYIVGVAESTMAQGDFGYVRWFGQVEGLQLKVDNVHIPQGTLLWVGQTPGSFTVTKPASGPRILMAVVERASQGNNNNAIILVRPSFGLSVENLENTNISVTPTNGDVLLYENSKWINSNRLVTTETNVNEHINNTSNPHSVTKTQVDLGNVDNTSDLNKPISAATQTALDSKATTTELNTHVNNTSNPHSVTATQVGLGNVTNESKSTMFSNPTFTGTVSGVTKSHVGLGNVDNTSDANKPISTATQTALDLKANLESPTFTGTPNAPTASAGTNTTQIATTAFVRTEVSNLIDSSPSTLDTLKELADALGNDANFATTVTTAIGLKQDASTALTTSTSFGGDVSGTYNAIVVADDSHNHIISNVDGLQTALDGKAASSHTHTINDVTNLQTALDGKASNTNPTFTGNATFDTDTFFVDGTNNRVGVGTITPSETLDINGNLKIKETKFTPLSEEDAKDIIGFIFNNRQSIQIPVAETFNQAVFFRPNGNDFYTVGTTADVIRRYTMSTSWDITTATETNTSATVGDTEPTGLYIKPDGLSLYITGRGSDVVREFSMSTAWDITSSSLTFVRSFSVASQDTSPEGISFSDDGTKMFIVGQSSDRVYQYNLSTAWNISTAVYNNVNLSLANFSSPSIYTENIPVDISFALGGTRLYVLGTARDNLYTFKLSTPYDLSTAQFFTKDFVVWNNQTGLYVRDDLSQAFLIDTGNRRVFEYVSKTKALQIDTDGIILNSKLQVNGDTKINGGLYVSSDSASPFVLDANSPSSVLKIQSSTSNNGGLSLASVFSTAVVSNNENGPLLLQTNTLTRMAITEAGLVGINTTAPTHLLSLSSTANTSGIQIRRNSNTTNDYAPLGFRINSTENATNSAEIRGIRTNRAVAGDSALSFHTFSNNALGERMRIIDNGNIGIGTSSPATLLHLTNPDATGTTIKLTSTTGGQTTSDGLDLVYIHPDAYLINREVGKMFFRTSNADRITIDSAGLVGIGTNNPSALLDVAGNIAVSGTVDGVDVGDFKTSYDNHTHGNISNTGNITSTVVTPANSDTILISDVSNSGKIERGITIGTGTTTFLRNDGTWAAPADTTTTLDSLGVTATATELNYVSGVTSNIQTQLNAKLDTSSSAQTKTGDLTVANFTAQDGKFKTLELTSSTSSIGVRFIAPDDIRGWVYTGRNFSVGAVEATPTGLFFRSNGEDFYIIGSSSDLIRRYTMSTAWDITTAVANGVSGAIGESVPSELFISPDGVNLYIIGSTTDTVRQFVMSTPWDITSSSLSFVQSFSVASQETIPEGLTFSNDGDKMYIVGTAQDTIYVYDLSTAWDISTAVYNNVSLNVGSADATPTSIDFNSDGTKLYITGLTKDYIHRYDLSTAWDISTAVFFGRTYIGFQELNPSGIFINDNPDLAFLVGSTSDRIFEYAREADSLVIESDINTINGQTEFTNNVFISENLHVQGTGSRIDGAISINGALTASGSVSIGSTTLILGSSSSTSTNSFASGATTSTNVKTVSMGTNGLAGSTTRFFIGPTNTGAAFRQTTYGGALQTTMSVDKTFVEKKINAVDYVAPLIVNGLNPYVDADTTIFNDTFTETSNTVLTSHTPDTGTGWTQLLQTAAATASVLTTGLLRPTTTIQNAGVLYRADHTPIKDMEVSATLVTTDSSDDTFHLAARIVDADNMYVVRFSSGLGNIYKRVSGTWTTLATLTTFPTNGTVVKFRVVGDIITLYYGTSLVSSVYDDGITDAGYGGLGFGTFGGLNTADDHDATWAIDDFSVKQYTTGLALVAEGNINVSGTVDGVDISEFKTAYDSHTHGDINNNGTITSTAVTPTDADYILISDTSASGAIKRGIEIGSSTNTFLRNDGTWVTPSGGGNVSTSGTITNNTIPYWVSGTAIGSLNTGTYPSLTELSYVKGATSDIQTQINGKQATLTNPVTGTGTLNQITYWSGTNTVGTLSTATYPSLTELSYVKGVTSAIQTQLNGKAASSHPHTKSDITNYGAIRTSLATRTATGTFTTATWSGYNEIELVFVHFTSTTDVDNITTKNEAVSVTSGATSNIVFSDVSNSPFPGSTITRKGLQITITGAGNATIGTLQMLPTSTTVGWTLLSYGTLPSGWTLQVNGITY